MRLHAPSWAATGAGAPEPFDFPSPRERGQALIERFNGCFQSPVSMPSDTPRKGPTPRKRGSQAARPKKDGLKDGSQVAIDESDDGAVAVDATDFKRALGLLEGLAKGQDTLAKRVATLEESRSSGSAAASSPKASRSGKKGFADMLKSRLEDFGVDLNERAAPDAGSSAGSSGSGSSGDSGQKRRRKRHHRSRRARKAFRDNFQKLNFALKDPMPLLERAGELLAEYGDWPLVGRASERVAPYVIPQLYQSQRRAVDWAKQWVMSKGLLGKKDGEAMLRHCYAIDLMLLYDFPKSGYRANPLNMASGEVLARDVYGLFQCYKLVLKESDLRSAGKTKAKTRYQLRADFDVVLMNDSELVAPDADTFAARMRKYDLAAAQGVGGEAPDES